MTPKRQQLLNGDIQKFINFQSACVNSFLGWLSLLTIRHSHKRHSKVFKFPEHFPPVYTDNSRWWCFQLRTEEDRHIINFDIVLVLALFSYTTHFRAVLCLPLSSNPNLTLSNALSCRCFTLRWLPQPCCGVSAADALSQSKNKNISSFCCAQASFRSFFPLFILFRERSFLEECCVFSPRLVKRLWGSTSISFSANSSLPNWYFICERCRTRLSSLSRFFYWYATSQDSNRELDFPVHQKGLMLPLSPPRPIKHPVQAASSVLTQTCRTKWPHTWHPGFRCPRSPFFWMLHNATAFFGRAMPIGFPAACRLVSGTYWQSAIPHLDGRKILRRRQWGGLQRISAGYRSKEITNWPIKPLILM